MYWWEVVIIEHGKEIDSLAFCGFEEDAKLIAARYIDTKVRLVKQIDGWIFKPVKKEI